MGRMVYLPTFTHRNVHHFMYLDLPKGAEWMIRGAHTPSLGSKQNPLEDAGRVFEKKNIPEAEA